MTINETVKSSSFQVSPINRRGEKKGWCILKKKQVLLQYLYCSLSFNWPRNPVFRFEASASLTIFLDICCFRSLFFFPWLRYCWPPSQDPVSMVMGCPCHCLASALQRFAVCRACCQACLFAGANVLHTGKLLNPWLTHSSVCCFVVNFTPDLWTFYVTVI